MFLHCSCRNSLLHILFTTGGEIYLNHYKLTTWSGLIKPQVPVCLRNVDAWAWFLTWLRLLFTVCWVVSWKYFACVWFNLIYKVRKVSKEKFIFLAWWLIEAFININIHILVAQWTPRGEQNMVIHNNLKISCKFNSLIPYAHRVLTRSYR